MLYGPTAVERAMKTQEVILRAMRGALSWLQAADIIGCSPRTMRRWRARYDRSGYDGRLDRRHGRPSPRRVSRAEVERLLRLYREQYLGFNVRHFHEIARRAHGLTLSYSFVKHALQGAGLVRMRRARGRHHQRREPRASFGEMLHLAGSPHPWLALVPEERQTLLAVLDDATNRLLYAHLVPAATTETVMGVEHIPAYSPQARGRSERLNRTLQDRLVNELRGANIRTAAAANAYLQTTFLPHYNATFTRPPREAAAAFVGLGPVDMDQILCHEEERVVGKDNTVTREGVVLQVPKQPGRTTCAGSRVTLRGHLDGTYTVWRGPILWSRYDFTGKRTHHVSNQPVTFTC